MTYPIPVSTAIRDTSVSCSQQAPQQMIVQQEAIVSQGPQLPLHALLEPIPIRLEQLVLLLVTLVTQATTVMKLH